MGIIKKIIETVPDILPKKEGEYGPEKHPAPKREDVESIKKILENAEKYFEENPHSEAAETGDSEVDEILKTDNFE